MNILIFEHDRCGVQRTGAFFERLGFHVSLSTNLKEVRQMLKSQNVDLVAYINVGPSNGVCADFLSLQSALIDRPIVVFSKTDDKFSCAYLEAGAQDYIVLDAEAESYICRSLSQALVRHRIHLESKKKLETLVEERTEKLMQSNEELRQFAKVAAHDLQEPLRAVQGFASLLAEEAKEKDSGRTNDYIDYILDGVERMQQLIRSVLAHSQINVDESLTHATNCNWVIEDVLADLRETIEETGTVISVGKLPLVAVERSQVVQLFQNLIGNSIKYRSSEAPQVVISASTEKHMNKCLFSVTDNGIGIDPKYSDKVFEMFSRLHAKTKYSGTGMGLAICKRIVTAHGGNIWIDSGVSVGTTLLFTLPAAGTPRSVQMNTVIEILLVEDTPSDVRLTEEALRRSRLKYKMKVVNDGVEAVEHLEQLKLSQSRLPDIILLDLNLPRKNGHEVLEEIKADSLLKHIPVVLLTVSEREEDVLEALKHKMNYYLAKPVKFERLSSLIKSIHDLQSQPIDADASFTADELHIRLVLAGNPHTSIVALTKLASDASDKVRARVAENPSIDSTLIEKLAEDPSSDVRLGICENPSVSALTLSRLARDSSEEVRLGLSANPRTPENLLRQLAGDDNVFISAMAANTLSAIPPATI